MRYYDLVELYENLEKTSKRLEKTYLISEFIKSKVLNLDEHKVNRIILLLLGKVAAAWERFNTGVSASILVGAISKSLGVSKDKIEGLWKEKGDLGLITEELIKKKKQSTLFQIELSIDKVFDNIRALALFEGKGSQERKIGIISELLTSANSLEGKYIVRTIMEELRIMVKESTIRDALLWAFFSDKIGLSYDPISKKIDVSNRTLFNEYQKRIQEAYDLTNDLTKVFIKLKSRSIDALESIELKPGQPVKVMLALKVDNLDEAFLRFNRAAFEFKYDGFRLQIHKKGKEVILFTRRLENVTKQFPDVVGTIKMLDGDFIIDSEAVGYDINTKQYRPFQEISQRIARKYDIKDVAEKYPVEVNVFDVIYHNGKSLIKEPFKSRRDILNGLVPNIPGKIKPSSLLITGNKDKAKAFFDESIKQGNEGLMIKALDAEYKPGARVGFMLKLKSVMETLDLVIVGAEWGEGKRANWLSSFSVAVIDEEGNFLDVGKVGTGIKEKTTDNLNFENLTNILKPLIFSKKGKSVFIKPMVLIEVNYEEIQKSPNYNSGYALRFPRVVKLRPDKSPGEATTLDYLEFLYREQIKRRK